MRKKNTIVSKTGPQAGKAVTDTLPDDFLEGEHILGSKNSQ